MLRDVAGEGVEAGNQLGESLGRIGHLVLGQLHGKRLYAEDVVDAQLVELPLVRLEMVASDEHQHVAGDDRLDVQLVALDGLSALQNVAQCGLVCGASLRTDVRQPIVIAVVAQDGGLHRIALQDSLPEFVCQLRDGGVGIGGYHGHTPQALKARNGGEFSARPLSGPAPRRGLRAVPER